MKSSLHIKNIEKCVSDAKFVKIDGAGHAIHVEQPEKFDTIVKGFLKLCSDAFSVKNEVTLIEEIRNIQGGSCNGY